MRRWASGFFQNFQSHNGQVLRSPSAILVVGSLLFDLLMMPVTYSAVVLWALHDPASLRWLLPSIAIHGAITTFIASRTITWKQAIVGFPCYWLANWWNKAIYFWTFIREWILGRHYTSWTGRQGRATEITPMSRRRKIGLMATTTAFALALGSLESAATKASPAQTAMLLLAITAAGAFALSFLCLQRPLTLVLSLSAAVVGGLLLNSGPQEAIPGWRYFWLLGLLTLAAGAAEFTLAYLRDDHGESARSFIA
jgi:hypothetical protein